jgi:hypothetical protein
MEYFHQLGRRRQLLGELPGTRRADCSETLLRFEDALVPETSQLAHLFVVERWPTTKERSEPCFSVGRVETLLGGTQRITDRKRLDQRFHAAAHMSVLPISYAVETM